MLLQQTRTREMIVQAAVACAAAGEWESTSLQAVRQQAGVSNGSLFHHFPTRQDLTAAVVSAGLHGHQQVLLAALAPGPRTAVTGVVRRHLQWVQENPALARLLLAAPPQALRASVPDAALEDNRRFFASVAAWLHKHGWRGAPELRVVNALWLGPAQECSRLWLAELGAWPLQAAADDLAAGAWSALSPMLHDNDDRRKTKEESQ